jgi:transglutaminase-like putative cysteine protease
MSQEGAADPVVITLAQNIVKSNPARDIYDWVKANMKYVPDPVDTELFYHPRLLVQEYHKEMPIQGDCDDMAMFTYALLTAAGVRARIVLLGINGSEPDHASAQIWSENLQEWIFCDTSTSVYPFGWNEKYVSMEVI